VNLKSIMTTAGVGLLSLLSFAPSTGLAQTNCTFVCAYEINPNCWLRVDSCGHATFIGSGCPLTEKRSGK